VNAMQRVSGTCLEITNSCHAPHRDRLPHPSPGSVTLSAKDALTKSPLTIPSPKDPLMARSQQLDAPKNRFFEARVTKGAQLSQRFPQWK
jgi:hypothetical protein